MRKPNRRPGSSWFMRRPDGVTYPNGYVNTMEDDLVGIYYFEAVGSANAFVMTRRDARLLAKRINQCLDATRKS